MVSAIQTQTKDVLTAKQAAAYLGISMETLYKLIDQGKIKAHRPSKRKFLILRSQLLEDISKL